MCVCSGGSGGTENRKGSVSDTAENMCSPTKVQRTCSFWEFSEVQHCGPSRVKCVCTMTEDSRQGQIMVDADCLEQECSTGEVLKNLEQGIDLITGLRELEVESQRPGNL